MITRAMPPRDADIDGLVFGCSRPGSAGSVAQYPDKPISETEGKSMRKACVELVEALAKAAQ